MTIFYQDFTQNTTFRYNNCIVLKTIVQFIFLGFQNTIQFTIFYKKLYCIVCYLAQPCWICIDLITDSGTAALSNSQWSDMMVADEAYAGGRSWNRFKNTCQGIFGFEHVFPAHQARAAENVLFGSMFTNEKEEFFVAGNGNYDTTKANLMIATSGLAKPVNITVRS